jgi:Ca2+-dependent lipid-binding protein
MWPYLDKAICNTIISTTKPIFDQYIGKYGIESIEFETLTLGTLPPIFQGIKVYEIQDKELVIEPAIRWAGNANIVVDLKLFHFKFLAQLIDLQLSLVPRLTLKPLVPTFPCFANINASLMEKPKVDFGFKLLNADLMAIPGLHHFVQVLAIPFLTEEDRDQYIYKFILTKVLFLFLRSVNRIWWQNK